MRLVLALFVCGLALSGCGTARNPDLPYWEAVDSDSDTPEAKAYDKTMIEKIMNIWWGLAESLPKNESGKIYAEFDLLPDGSIKNLTITNKSGLMTPKVDVCKQAILTTAPYPPFPKSVKKEWNNPRHIGITFRFGD